MSFLIDTDICSAYLRAHRKLIARFGQYAGRLHLSTITVGELRAWTLRAKATAKRRQDINDLIKIVTTLDVDRGVADMFGQIRAQQLDMGKQTPKLDLFSAATALVHQLTVVTHNTRHFAPIPGLHVIDWLAP